jgi:hypothetical protein
MTILNVRLSEQSVCILTDTLCCDADQGGMPATFATKVFPVPHMRGLVVGAGLFAFIMEWATLLNGALTFSDMRALDKAAPLLLKDLFSKHRGEDSRPLQTTVYHFGYDRRRESFFGQRYRSAGGFSRARVPYGTITHPFIDYELERNAKASFPEDFIVFAKRQKEELKVSKDGMAGGQLIAHRMEVVGADVVTSAAVVHEFDDFGKLSEKLVTRYPHT